MRGSRRLVLVWAMMAAATLAAIPIGHAADARPLPPPALLILLGLAFVKSALILDTYLDLQRAPGWNGALRASILLLVLIIAGLSLVALVR